VTRINPAVRVLAVMIDTLLALLLTALLASSAGWFFAERAVSTFRIYSPDTIWNGPVPLVLGAISPLSYGFAFALVVVLASEGFLGASMGKAAVRIRVAAASGSDAPQRRIMVRFVLKTAPWWVFCLALLAGRWELVVLAVLLGAGAVTDLFVALITRRNLWHDRLAGTRLVTLAHSSHKIL